MWKSEVIFEEIAMKFSIHLSLIISIQMRYIIKNRKQFHKSLRRIMLPQKQKSTTEKATNNHHSYKSSRNSSRFSYQNSKKKTEKLKSEKRDLYLKENGEKERKGRRGIAEIWSFEIETSLPRSLQGLGGE